MTRDQDRTGPQADHEFGAGEHEVAERLFGLIWRVALIGLALVVLTPAARLGG
jgi:hypothetical protein